MFDLQVKRLQDAYPTIYLACHRQHIRTDEQGKNVTERQASVLDHLDTRTPVTLSKLAEHLGVSRSTMSITVSRLVRNGYISRRKDAKDARSIALVLTARGARIKEENAVLNPKEIEKLFGLMRPAELDTALRGIEVLAKYARIQLRNRKRDRDR